MKGMEENCMANILVTARSFAKLPQTKTMFEAAGHNVLFSPVDRPLKEAELAELIVDADAIVAGMDEITEKVFAAADRLKIVARHGVGYDNIDLAAAKKYNIPVTITPSGPTKATAELTMALILSVARNVPQMDRAIRNGSWSRITGCEVAEKTLGIIGLGRIGCEVAKRAQAFEMNVIAYDFYPNVKLAEQYGIPFVSFEDMVAAADFISLHVPATKETNGLMNKQAFEKMKSTAYLINASRGSVVVEKDLCEALEKGEIAGAGLDAFEQEPLGQSPLLELSNVVLTPHIGGSTKESTIRMAIAAAEEVLRVLAGESPKDPVVLR
jgi:D-3-phosphoglycerate dehydrogenase